MSDSASAALAALMPIMSGSFSLSAENTRAITWVSLRKPSGKQRANRAIDLAAGQDLALARAAFALDKSAGNASAGIGVFAVIHGQGKEVHAFARIGRGDGSGQHYAITLGDERGAGGLLGHPSGFKMQMLAAGKLDGHVVFHKFLISLSVSVTVAQSGSAEREKAARPYGQPPWGSAGPFSGQLHQIALSL